MAYTRGRSNPIHIVWGRYFLLHGDPSINLPFISAARKMLLTTGIVSTILGKATSFYKVWFFLTLLSVPMCESLYVNRTSFKDRDWVGAPLTMLRVWWLGLPEGVGSRQVIQQWHFHGVDLPFTNLSWRAISLLHRKPSWRGTSTMRSEKQAKKGLSILA